MLPRSPITPRTERVLIPSTSATWELDSNSEADTEEEEEVEEMLIQQPLPLHPSAFPRDSFLLATEAGKIGGDDLPGSKARKIMGISTESEFEDWDEEDRTKSPSPKPLNMKRTRSLKDAFRLNKPRGHRRGASLDESFDSDSDVGDLPPLQQVRKRRPSLSSVFGVSPSSSVPASPRQQATMSPVLGATNLLKRRPTLSSRKTDKPIPTASKDTPRMEEGAWSKELKQAAEAAKWHTSIEQSHQQYKDGGDTKTEKKVTCRNRSGSGPAPSPALSTQLTQMAGSAKQYSMERSATSDGYSLAKQSAADWQRRPSLPLPSTSASASTPLSPTPPRPPRSALRESRRRAVISPPPPPHVPGKKESQEPAPAASSNNIEFMRPDSSHEGIRRSMVKIEDLRLTSTSPFSSSSSKSQSGESSQMDRFSASPSPSSQQSHQWRRSVLDSSSSIYEDIVGRSSPGLSVSSSMTSSSNMDVPLMIKDWSKRGSDVGRPISPLMNPRKAPLPPDPVWTLEDAAVEESPIMRQDKPLPPMPLFHRTDSNILDPDMSEEQNEDNDDAPLNALVTPNTVHQSDRPISVPFSPPSAHAHELSFIDNQEEEEQYDENASEDEFMAALNKLGSHLELSNALSLDYERHAHVSIPIDFVHAQDEMGRPLEFPFALPSPVTSPQLEAQGAKGVAISKSAAGFVLQDHAQVNSSSSSSSTADTDEDSDDRRLSNKQGIDDDSDAVHFFRSYVHTRS